MKLTVQAGGYKQRVAVGAMLQTLRDRMAGKAQITDVLGKQIQKDEDDEDQEEVKRAPQTSLMLEPLSS